MTSHPCANGRSKRASVGSIAKAANIAGTATNPRTCTTFVRISLSCATMSLSKNRPKKCRTSSVIARNSGLLHDGDDLSRRGPDVLLLRELPEDLLERRQVH